MTAEAAPRFRTNPDVVGRVFDGAEILVHLGSNLMFELNPTASRVFRLLSDGHDVEAIVAQLAVEFDAAEGEIVADVESVVADLVRDGLVVDSVGARSVIEAANVSVEIMTPVPRAQGSWASWRPSAGIAPLVHGCEVADSARGDRFVLMGRLAGTNAGAANLAAKWREGEEGARLDQLRGSFALAVWDREHDRLTLMRDATGMSPCFYRWHDGLLSWSTSIDALLDRGVPAHPNRAILADYIEDRWKPAQAGETFFEGIKRLPPAHRLVLRNGELTVERYCQLARADSGWATQAEMDEVPDRLRGAVRRALDDGADAIALSGGFDSIALALLMRELEPTRSFTAISLAFAGSACDERATQIAAARELGFRHELEVVEIGGEDFVDMALAGSATSPSPVLGPWQWLYGRVLDRAAHQGIRRVVFGTGGDEMFIVDPVFARDLIARRDFRGLFGFVRAWQRTSQIPAWQVAHQLIWRSGARPLIGRIARGQSTGDAYPEALRAVLDSSALLVEIDQGCAWAKGFGIEMALPYYDRDLADLVLRVPPESLYRGGRMKDPLRRLVAERLPGVVVPQKKVNFTELGNQVLRRAGANTWRRLGGARALGKLGILDTRKADATMQELFTRGRNWLRPWMILSSEVWLRARFGEA